MNKGLDSFRNPCERLKKYRLSQILNVGRYEFILNTEID